MDANVKAKEIVDFITSNINDVTVEGVSEPVFLVIDNVQNRWVDEIVKILKPDVQEIVLESVRSSAIAAVGYYAPSQLLEVVFKKGGKYRYFEVPQDVYDSLRSADSIGSYFHKIIKSKFQFEKVV